MSTKKPKSAKQTKPPVRRGGKGKMKSVRKSKSKATTFKCWADCGGEFTDRSQGGWHGPEGQLRWHCQDCLPKTRKPKKVEDEFAWYVLQCEPDKDRYVAKDVRKKLRIESLEHLVKRILIPTELRETIVEERGTVISAGGGCIDLHEAKTQSLLAAKAAAGIPANQVTEGVISGYKTSCFQDYTERLVPTKSGKEKKVRMPNAKWRWTVRKLPEDPKASRKVVPCKKFPGYVLFHMKWSPFLDAMILKVRSAWGFLLRPVIQNTIVQVQQSKATGKWSWKLRHPETREILTDDNGKKMRRRGYETKGAAAHDGGLAKANLEEFHPTAVKTKEATLLLVEQKAVNEILKDKEELNRVQNAARVGDTVKIKPPHAFAGSECVVTKVQNGADPKADVQAELWGNKIPICDVNLWQLEIVNRMTKNKETK